VIRILVPNVSDLTRNLNILSRSCGALETVIFEKNTFLLVAKSSVDEPENDSLMVKHNVSEEATSSENAAVQPTRTAGPINRFELITKLIKTFKNDSRKHSSEEFESLRMELADFTLVLESLTATSYVLVIASNDEPRISKVSSIIFPQALMPLPQPLKPLLSILQVYGHGLKPCKSPLSEEVTTNADRMPYRNSIKCSFHASRVSVLLPNTKK
jgi:hypothetical protein